MCTLLCLTSTVSTHIVSPQLQASSYSSCCSLELNIYILFKAIRPSPSVACSVGKAWSGDVLGFHILEPDSQNINADGSGLAAFVGELSYLRLAAILEYGVAGQSQIVLHCCCHITMTLMAVSLTAASSAVIMLVDFSCGLQEQAPLLASLELSTKCQRIHHLFDKCACCLAFGQEDNSIDMIGKHSN